MKYCLFTNPASSDRNEINSSFEVSASQPSTNFSSILNVPQRSQGIFVQLFTILQQSILEKPFFMNLVRQNQSTTPQITLSQAQGIVEGNKQQYSLEDILNVESRDFIHYLEVIGDQMAHFQKIRNGKTAHHVDESVDLDQMALQCYESVPNVFFDLKFYFNWEELSKSLEEINQYQDQLSAFLDEVEINLFYQINSRFDQFLSVVLNLNEMSEMIDNNLGKVSKFRMTLAQTKQKFIIKSKQIIQKKKQLEQMENSLQIMKLMQIQERSCNNLQELIKNQKYEQAIKLLKTAETYEALKQMPNRLNSLSNQLQQALTSHIIQIYIQSLIQQLQPFKILSPTLVTESQNEEIANSSFFQQNDSWFDQSSSVYVQPLKQEVIRDSTNQLSKLLVAASGVIDLGNHIFRNRVLEELRSFFNDFLSSLSDFLGRSQQQQTYLSNTEPEDLEALGEAFEKLTVPMFVKVVMFLAENFRRCILNQIQLAKASEVIQNDEVIEEAYSTVAAMLKFANEKICSLLGLRQAFLSVKEFKEILSIFTFWEKFYEEEFKMPRCQQKCSINQVIYLRGEQEKMYFTQLHRDRLTQLRKRLEEDNWTSADIIFDNYEIIYFLNGLQPIESDDNMKTSMFESQLDESMLLNTSMAGDQKHQKTQLSVLQQLVNNQVFKIVKTEIWLLKEQAKFKVTGAFLYFLSVVYDYLQVLSQVHLITAEQIQKLQEILKLYNSYSTQLILGAGAIHFGILKTIAARNLAISSQCIRFFLYLYDPIVKRVLNVIQNSQLNSQQVSTEFGKIKGDYSNHNQEIVTKITTLLQDRVQEQCSEIVKQNWNDPQSRLTTPSKFTAQMLNSTRQMYIAVEELFLIDDLTEAFSKIVEYLKCCYIQTFKGLSINSKLGATRVKEELEYFKNSLSEIGNLKDLLKTQLEALDGEMQNLIDEKCKSLLQEPQS